MGSNNSKRNPKLLYPDLSYKIQGAMFEIRNNYGSGQKEVIYQRLLAELLESKGFSVNREVRVNIRSKESGKVVGWYQPDLVVDDKIVFEIKAKRITNRQDEKQLYFYLKNSKYELGYLVNFGSKNLFFKRIVYSNSKKPWLKN